MFNYCQEIVLVNLRGTLDVNNIFSSEKVSHICIFMDESSWQEIRCDNGFSDCAVPENIHTSPTEGIGIFWGVGGSVRPKKLKKCMKLHWNFQRGGVS